MIDLTGVKHHPAIDEIVEVLCNKTQNTDRSFFQAEAAYFLGKMASSQRATIVTRDRGEIPVSVYVIALASSGFGKGYSVGIFENELMPGFQKRFMEDTFPVIAEQNLWKIANGRAARNGTDQNEEFERAEGEYKRAGSYTFTFDSATVPAIKQLRHKMILADCGALNLQVDEIGSNLGSSIEVMNAYLELYDQGRIKNKLVKNTAENQRNEDIDGKTPANALLFGTPSKLLDGSTTENQFYDFLDTGYARRSIFGYGMHTSKAHHTQSAEEIYQRLTEPTNNAAVAKWAAKFHKLADPAMYGWTMTVPDPVGIELTRYRVACEIAAEAMPEHQEIRKAEMSHRYFKALKLAGALAFVDESMEVEMHHLKSAILLVEQSGEAFQHILTREKAYVRLAKYIADVGTEVTHSDLHEALPFYKSGTAARNEMMTLAVGWGYKKHIVIKKRFVEGIEFFSGEKLAETNLNSMVLTYSDHWAYNYGAEDNIAFDQLHVLTQAEGMHWCNHRFRAGHRSEENVIVGFNMIVIDVDGTCPLSTAHELLKDYKFMTYTTKRHQVDDNGDRYRIVIPMNYYLELDSEDYKEFMNNVMDWLPFATDESANKREKKWETFHGGSHHYNMDGQLLDVLGFIPRTSRNEQYKQGYQKIESFDNLERWFAQRIAQGNRNNNMIKYALALVDAGLTHVEISESVHAFNKKLSNPLDSDEIDNTILRTVAKQCMEN